ncbi:hypothetical protein H6P81_020290 [Aristolochia fimbriata]|uniref:AMP-dependent synthetase/ligase domain-containing protein n=1 Tax=Aristolochia fimbriata TaxID=158543 RepID=A0AAV7DVX3_ARIFI|nr:hypothetical protein H6P81_020290 [Aristolochia fimbriata]
MAGYGTDLPRNGANYTALTPLWFLERAAVVHPNRKSLIHGSCQYTWLQTYQRSRQLASALSRRSIGVGKTVSVIAPNIPATYEAHFGVPMAGAVLNCVNIRLNASNIPHLLHHSSAAVVMVDQEFFSLAVEALKIIDEKHHQSSNFETLLVIVIGDESCDRRTLEYALHKGAVEYERFLQSGDPEFVWNPPKDEWQSIALNYTSGTTSSPKGVLLHHRGAYLMSLSAALMWGMNQGPVYLWTLPMFHCNGWCYTWTLAALCGTNICLRQIQELGISCALSKLFRLFASGLNGVIYAWDRRLRHYPYVQLTSNSHSSLNSIQLNMKNWGIFVEEENPLPSNVTKRTARN